MNDVARTRDALSKLPQGMAIRAAAIMMARWAAEDSVEELMSNGTTKLPVDVNGKPYVTQKIFREMERKALDAAQVAKEREKEMKALKAQHAKTLEHMSKQYDINFADETRALEAERDDARTYAQQKEIEADRTKKDLATAIRVGERLQARVNELEASQANTEAPAKRGLLARAFGL